MIEHPDAELEYLFEDVYRLYHHDFRAYVRASLRRRVEQALTALGYPSVAALRVQLRSNPLVFSRFLDFMTVQVSEMFRTPSFWRALREQVLPHMATYPFVRIWIAGCATGEEAYSMAILLEEEGLLDRAQVYATDIDAASLEHGRTGSYPLERIKTFSDAYFHSGGKASLSDYYTTTVSRAVFLPRLRKRILFSDHSLATDNAFAEVQLVSCRNVLIYFERLLQARAFRLFSDALVSRGFLGLGDKESIPLAVHHQPFEPFVAEEKIYRKRGEA
jgi:chemotaxis protein methyltransferase CheR